MEISLNVCAFVWAKRQARLSDRVNQVLVFVFVFLPCNLCFSHTPSLLPPRPRDAPFATRSFNHAPYSLTAQPLCSARSPPHTTARPRPRPGPLPQTPPSPRSASLPHSHAVRRPLPFTDLISGLNLPGKVSATEQSEKRRYPWCVFVWLARGVYPADYLCKLQLSQQLSTFSLCQDISPEMLAQETTLASPFKCASHTTSASLTTPYTSTFKHHLSVKHIPQKSKSAGPKFVTQNAKDRHIKDISPTRPASGDHLADWDASHPSSDEPDLEWLQSGEWLPPLQSKENNVQGCLQGSLQHCRDTDCSLSSMEFGGSDTSSVSLLSLSRSSLDHQTRPDIVQWDEIPTETDEEQEEHRGLGAQPRSSALHLPVKLHSSPSISPFIASDCHKSPNDSQADFPMNSPSIFNARSSQHARSDSRSTILPRLLLSKKSTATLREQKEKSNVLGHMEDDEMMSDVEDIPSPKSPSRSRSFWDRAKFKTSRNPFDGNGLGATFGLGIELGPHRIPPSEGHNENNRLSVSIASDSSEDADLSPSRSLLSNRRSVSTFAHGPPRENVPEVASKREAPIRPTMPRRMATVGSIFRRMPRTSTPVIPTLNSLRGKGRPPMRRGTTDPTEKPKSNLQVADAALNTPQALPFADIKPSPSVFASAGLVQKKSRFSGVEIPKFGSEPLADVKRKQSAWQYGTQPGDGSVQPPSPISPIQSMSAPSIPLKGAGFAAAVSSNAHFAQQAQKTRGLRKKRSSMFKTGSSISSMDMIRGSSRGSMSGVSLSPVTPTKHDGKSIS